MAALEAKAQQARIRETWRGRDRAVFRRKSEVLAARRLPEAQMACLAAIAGMRRAVDHPDAFEQWLRAQDPAPPPVASGLWGGSGPAWGGGGGWCTHDPNWDGVTRTPKVPQKRKRRKKVKRERKAAWARQEAEHAEEVRLFLEREMYSWDRGSLSECR